MTTALTKNMNTTDLSLIGLNSATYASDKYKNFNVKDFDMVFRNTFENHNKNNSTVKNTNTKEIQNLKELHDYLKTFNSENKSDDTSNNNLADIIKQLKEGDFTENLKDLMNKFDDFKESLDEDTLNELIEELAALISTGEISLNTPSVDNSEIIDNYEQEETNQNLDTKVKIMDKTETTKEVEHSESELSEDMLDELNIESISSESDYSNDNYASQKQSPEEYGIKMIISKNAENIETNFAKNINSNTAKLTDVTPEKIIEQLTKQMDALKTNSRLNMVLNPESLGKINLQILNTKDGLSAQMTVTTNEARDLLMKGLDGLKEALLAQGVGVDNLSVKVTETEETAYNPDWLEQEDSKNQQKESGKQNRDEKEKGLFEKTIAESLKQNNNV